MRPLAWMRRFAGSLLAFVTGLVPCLLPAGQAFLRAVDQSTGTGIPEAVLSLETYGELHLSDASGWIQILNLPVGVHEAVLSAGGFARRRLRIEIPGPEAVFRREILLEPVVTNLAEFEVRGSLTDEDRDALAKRQAVTPTEQLSGEELRDVTDNGVGESLEKITGVTVDTEEGSVSGISIRGTGPRQTRLTLDGQSLTGGGGRGTTRGARAMNRIPREFLDRVLVMKAPTPDMDADAIGGTVDLQTSRIARRGQSSSSLSHRSAWQAEEGTWGHRFNLAHAQPIQLRESGKRLGVLLALNAETNERKADLLRVLNQWPLRQVPELGEPVRFMARLRAGSQENGNDGWGVILSTDLELSKTSHFQLKTLWNEDVRRQRNEFHTYEFLRGRIVSLRPDFAEVTNMRLEKQFLDREFRDTSGSIVIAGEHRLGPWKIDESIGWSFARSMTRNGENSIFQTKRDIDGAYALSPDPSRPVIRLALNERELTAIELQDPRPFTFTRFDLIDQSAEDAELAARLNASRTMDTGKAVWTLKGGLKGRFREADNDEDRRKYYPADIPFSLAEVSQSGEPTVFGDLYPLGPGLAPSAMQARLDQQPGDFELDPFDERFDSAASDFEISESIYAAFGMVQRETDDWVAIFGVRLERTDSETSGYETVSQIDPDGERVVEVKPVSIRDSYDFFFPGVHFLYRLKNNWIARASATRSLQRPDFRDLSPSLRVNLDQKRIRAGNPGLEPFDAHALDIGTDIVLSGWGSFSLGVFYKRIDNFIVDVEEEANYLDEPGFILSRPVNGSPADLVGLESGWAGSLRFLPEPLDELRFNVNYMLTDSTAAYPGYPGEIIMLPHQVRQTFNLAMQWRRDNWTLNLRTRYRGRQLRDLIEPGQDQFNAGFWSHSVRLNYQFNDTVDLSVAVANINAPDRIQYQGDPSQMVANRQDSQVFSIGVNVNFGKGLLASLVRENREDGNDD